MGSVVAICIGACAGALARWQLGLWLSTGGLIPWGTLAANLVGGYLVGSKRHTASICGID